MEEKKRYLKIAVPQFHMVLPRKVHEIYENMERVERQVKKITENENDVDMLLFCEECIDNVGVQNAKRLLTEDVLQDIESFWKRMATLAGTYITAGHVGREKDWWRNYATCFAPGGDIVARYAKSHLYFSERDFYKPGDDPLVFDFKGWKVSMLICADLGFPEFSRIMAMRGCELFLAPSSWIYPHDELWILSNRLRAAENMAYFVSANHCGKTPEGTYKLGRSMAVNPRGEIIASNGTQLEGYFVANLDKELVARERAELPWLDWVRPELYRKLY